MNSLTEQEAQQYLEKLRWPNGPRCPFCKLHQVTKLNGKRQGFYQCNRCRQQFTVRTGTVFERSHIPLHKWLQAVHLICASKKGMSSLQLSRMLGITYKSAWFLAHRIRHAMSRPGGLLTGIIEVDETYVGGKQHNAQRGRSTQKKTPVMALIQRDGQARTRVINSVSSRSLRKVIREHVDIEAVIMTDDFLSYRHLDDEFADHHAVVHSKKEYARGPVHVNNCESFFALLKRGIMGSFHHVSREHLHRYADEFAFRWNYRKVTDAERTDAALRLAEGKRLRYRILADGKEAEGTN